MASIEEGRAAHTPKRSLLRRLGDIGDSVMITHTLFSLPFVVSAILLETNGRPPFWKLFWIVVAAFGARNAANALNRLIDKDIDAQNPRTASRHLPSGRLTPRELWIFTGAMLALLVLGAAMLNPLLCHTLASRRFSSHRIFLHKAIYLADALLARRRLLRGNMGAFWYIGLLELRYFPITGGVALWVAGFDIIYALQDIEFDRAHHIYSIPARFGANNARIIAALSHIGAFLGFLSIYYFWDAPGLWTGIALVICAFLLASEHIIALQKSEHRIKLAAYYVKSGNSYHFYDWDCARYLPALESLIWQCVTSSASQGASGSLYALRLLSALAARGIILHVVASPWGARVLMEETGRPLGYWLGRLRASGGPDGSPTFITQHESNDLAAPIASGSFRLQGTAIVPCSMSTLGAIASGTCTHLIHRAGAVALKEGWPLILVPRETPLSLVSIRAMAQLKEAGAVILPASPSFYSKPSSIESLVDTVVYRILDHLQIADKNISMSD